MRQKFGHLTIVLKCERNHVVGGKLSVPSLDINEDLRTVTRLLNLKAGIYEGELTLYLSYGKERKKPLQIRILPDQNNLCEFDVTRIEERVLLRPVDAENRTQMSAQIKVEGIDDRFRQVRDWKGVSYELRPGEYEVAVVLPDLQMRRVPLKIQRGVDSYRLLLKDRTTPKRRETRVDLSISVDYRKDNDGWISTSTVNASLSGVCLLKKTGIKIDEYIDVRLFSPVSHFFVQCDGRVRWLKEGIPQMGVELFPTKTTQDHLRSWLETIR